MAASIVQFMVSCSLLLFTSKYAASQAEVDSPRIAIIGGGIGGVTAGYYSNKLFGDSVHVDLFEKDDVGGRMASVNLGFRDYEVGAAIFHPSNQYMVNFTRWMGLKAREKVPESKLGLHDGEQFVFTEAHWQVATLGKIFWRYGFDLFKISGIVDAMTANFSRIYKHQDAGFAFTTVEKLLKSMSSEFPDLTKYSLKEHLLKQGVSEIFIDEFVSAAMKANYGQGTDAHAFVGMVCVAGVQPGLWSVHGGNKMIPIRLLEKSKVSRVKAKVTKVIKINSRLDKYTLEYVTSDVDAEDRTPKQQEYDIVIIATPLTKELSSIKFEGFGEPLPDTEMPYHRTIAYMYLGEPNIGTFGYYVYQNYLERIISTKPNFFSSFARHYPVDYNPVIDKERYNDKVFKVFANQDLTEQQVRDLMQSVTDEDLVDWQAYPHYGSTVTLPSFVLNQNLYYVNAIEAAASAGEMSAVGGRNVALLAYHNWHGKTGKVDMNIGLKAKHKQSKGEL